jgi:hypothetical protein
MDKDSHDQCENFVYKEVALPGELDGKRGKEGDNEVESGMLAELLFPAFRLCCYARQTASSYSTLACFRQLESQRPAR